MEESRTQEQKHFVAPPQRLRLPKPSDFWKPIPKPKPRPQTAVSPLPCSWDSSSMAAGLKGSTRSDRLVQKVEASRATIKQIERQLANIPKPPAENDAFDRYAADEFVASNARLLRNLRKQKKMLRKQVKKLKAQAVPKPPKKRPPQGKTDSQYEAYISSPQWAEFRERILEARGRRCEGCGADAKVLHIHHLHYRNFGHEKPEDVCILCVPCHEATHGKKIGRRRKTGTTAGLPAAATHSPELAALSAATA